MTKGRVIAALAACIAFLAIAQTASAQYPEPHGSMTCTVSSASIAQDGDLNFTAILLDGAGKALAGQGVSFSVSGGDPSANYVNTNAAGQASVKIHAGNSAGRLTVEAQAGDGVQCRAVSEVLGSVIKAPPTGDGGLADQSARKVGLNDAAASLGVETYQLALAGVFVGLALSAFWLTSKA